MLTRKQHELLMFIHERIKETGVSPSFDEMKEALDLASKSGIHRLITALEERGFLRRLAHRARALEVLKLPEQATTAAPPRGRTTFLPRVVEAGRPPAPANDVRELPVLPLGKAGSLPGEPVTVIGYPMGIAGMVAKSPTGIYQRLAYRHGDITAASELAALPLIRPSTTCGHLGDVVGEKLIYDAPTAHGGSGGPVFNSHAEVIGVNSAYIDGFSGGTLGVSVTALRPLIAAAEKKP